MKNLILTVTIALLMMGCASTTIEKSWKDPNASVTKSPDNKVFIIALVKDETSRRVIEDILVTRFNNNAAASYKTITLDMLKNASENSLDEQLQKGNFTHVLLMRLADVEKDTYYVEGTTTAYYGGYGRYYGYGAGYYSSPGYYTTDKNYFVETTVYSVNPNKLLWTGTTKTVNPSKIDKTVNEIADAVSVKMRNDGFLK
ncbi:hypothetical protein ACSVH2_06930 [Flavobacterium sp. RSB2_4_14]|uniref:hypothetical protein n=1 Tax=Flavobacterium sp. RSB2_4_14 TaxID=3447665 RepID=UPI003F3CEB60